jgi:dolichol-phosphate mannosyltransferase
MNVARALPERSIDLATIKLGIVCPMANEEDSALRFVRAVLQHCTDFKETAFFVVLDKANRDSTLDLLREYAADEPALRVIWAPENRTIADAYVRGYRAALEAGSDWILEIDAGFSHQPEDLPKFFDAMRQGYDCVFGSRFAPGGTMRECSWRRCLISKGGSLLTNLLLGTQLADMTSGFELFTNSALTMILEKGIHSRAHFFQTEIKVHCRNLALVEVPISYRMASPRVDFSCITEAFSQLWRLFRLRLANRL